MKRLFYTVSTIAAVITTVAVLGQASGQVGDNEESSKSSVETFFGPSRTDEAYFYRYTAPSSFLEALSQFHRQPGERYVASAPRNNHPVCSAYLKNISKRGGFVGAGCWFPESRGEISLLKWQELGIAKNLPLIKQIVTAGYNIAYPQESRDDSNWEKMAPVLRYLAQTDGLRLRKTTVDIADTGTAITVYGLTLIPHASCLDGRGGVSSDISYLYTDDESPAGRELNAAGLGGTPFLYKKQAFIASSGSISQPQILNSLGVKTLQLIPVCEFRATTFNPKR